MLKKDGSELEIPEDASGELSRYVEFVASDGRAYGFPLAQLVNYVLEANPESDGDKDAPPDRLTFYFSSHDVILLGWRLIRLTEVLKKERLPSVSVTEQRYSEMHRTSPAVSKIKVKPIAEK
jgi:hypothetical protein